MPSLYAILSANANPMRVEFEKAKGYAAVAGRDIQRNLEGGAGGNLRAGAMREFLVLMREISRGNWTRVPGSFTLLLDRMGILGKVFSAVSIGTFAAAFAAVAATAIVVYEKFWGMKKAMEGMATVALKLDYIPKMLRSSSEQLVVQQKITDEVRKTVDAYNSAAASATRVSATISEHYNHLKKMNEFEKDPQKKAARELEIDRQERNTQLATKMAEQQNLIAQSESKRRQAAGIHVRTAAEDAELKKQVDANAAAAEKFLTTPSGKWNEFKKELAIQAGSLTPTGEKNARMALAAAEQINADNAKGFINTRNKFLDTEQANNELRRQKAEAESEAAKAAAEAAKLALEIPEIQKANAQRNKDEAEEAQAKLNSERRILHGSMDSLQKIGAYASPATVSLVSLATKQLVRLDSIDKGISKIGGGSGSGIGRVKF